MSRLSRLRKAVNYDTDIPRCQTCKHLRKPGSFLKNSLPVKSPALCKQHDFTVQLLSVCDNWTGRKGETLHESDVKDAK
jgi:hypothetical protein